MYDCDKQLQVVGVGISKSLPLIPPSHVNITCENGVLFWVLYLLKLIWADEPWTNKLRLGVQTLEDSVQWVAQIISRLRKIKV